MVTVTTRAVPFVYNVDRIIKVKDGDTVALVVDLGFDTLRKIDVRINGVDAPEKNARDLAERQAAKVSLRAVEDWIADHFDLGIATESHKLDPADKYGRVLGDLVCPRAPTAVGQRLTTFLFAHGYVRSYGGGQRTAWSSEALAKIAASPVARALFGSDTATFKKP